MTEQSGLFAGEGCYHINANNVHLEGGAIASTNPSQSELSTNIFTGKNGIYGFDGKIGAQASAISGEAKGCLGTKESWAMICGKVGANAGPAFDVGGKAIWDNTKEVLQLSAKAIGGVEVDMRFDWNKFKEVFK